MVNLEKVAGYLCFKNQSKESMNLNLKQMSEWCLLKNYDCTIYFDKVKNRLDLDRNELNKLKHDIQDGKYKKLIIKDMTNVSRNTTFNIEFLQFLDDNDCKVESMDGIDLDLFKNIFNKNKEEKER